MPNITIREIQGDEMLEVMYWLDSYAFQPSPPLTDKGESQEAFKSRKGVTYFALFENDTPVSIAASTPMTQQVRGALFAMAGIWGVITHPAARRKGYSRRVLAHLLAKIRQEGQTLSCLYPFRESFYERLGYVTFPQYRKLQISPSALLPLLDKDLDGEVELLLIGDGYATFRNYLSELQHRVHGMAIFDFDDESFAQRNNYWLALTKVDGELDSLMMYNLKGNLPTEFNLRAIYFYYLTSQGKYLLLKYLAQHYDQAKQIELYLPPFEQPETWLADMDVKPQPIFRAAMGRVLDVVNIAGMHTGPGRFSARIIDSLCPWNEGCWQFETVDGMLTVTAGEEADCELTIQALSALIYGTHQVDDFAIRGWGNPSPELQHTMQSIFPSMLPYLHEHF